MKKTILTEVVWLLIVIVFYGVWAVLSGVNKVFIIGTLLYAALRISYWYGKLNQ